jgi:hypothetical protein
MDNESDTETSITVRVPRSLVARLKDTARRDERTLSSLVRKVLLEFSPGPQAKRKTKSP